MKGFNNEDFNALAVYQKGPKRFKANIKALVSKGKIGKKVEDEWIGPTDAEIDAKYAELVAPFKAEEKKDEAKKVAEAKVEPKKTDK